MYDVLILGGGPGGYHAALCAAKEGLSVALVNDGLLGGVCLNEGCVPTKTFLHSAKHLKTHEEFGVTHEAPRLDFLSLQARKRNIIDTLVKSIAASIKKAGVTYIEGKGIVSPVADGFAVVANDATIEAKKLIIATGSKAIVPPIPGAELSHVYTSGDMLELTEIPQNLIVVGGGVIGLEMATFFAAAGTTVTVVEATDAVGGSIDKDCEKILRSALKKKGIQILCNTKVTTIENDSVTIEDVKGSKTVIADAVLLSVGRKPNSAGIDLEELGVVSENGVIETDNCCRTTVDGLYAIGDVNGKWLLAHTAYAEAETVIATIAGRKKKIDYDSIPSVIYTAPEASSVGLTEMQATDRGLEYVVKKRPLGGNGRFLAETHKERGLCKVLISSDGVILGVHMVGVYASELVHAAAMMVQLKLTVEQVEQLVLPHPTVGEIIKEIIVEG